MELFVEKGILRNRHDSVFPAVAYSIIAYGPNWIEPKQN
jgi:hypothetical protein